jgi:DNA primase
LPTGSSDRPLKRVDLSEVDVEKFLTSLGFRNISHADADVRFSCPYPEHSYGDNNPSAYMNKDTTAFICFSCGRTGNAVTLLADFMNVSRTVARYWIAQKWSAHFVAVDNLAAHVRSMFTEMEQDGEVETVVLDESALDVRRCDWSVAYEHFMNGLGEGPLGYIFDRGISPETLARFEVCYDYLSNRPCLTVRDEHGQLVGFKGRAWREDQVPKYMVVGDTERSVERYGTRYGFAPYDASRYVFGLDRATPVDGTLNFIEGEFNVVSMHDKGFENSCGPSGSTVTDHQVRLVVQRCERVVVFFDCDLGDPMKANLAQNKINRVVERFEPFVSTLVVPVHDCDPNQMTRDEIARLVENAESSITQRLVRMLGIAR